MDIKPLLVHASESHMTATEARSIVVDVPDSLPTAAADADKLAQVVDNLVSNAIKYSPSGGAICISARHERKLNRIVVSVADGGIGISDEDQEHLFIVRSNASTAPRRRGSGTPASASTSSRGSSSSCTARSG